LAECLFFLHSRSTPHVHGAVNPWTLLIDGETHRGKLLDGHVAATLVALIDKDSIWNGYGNPSKYTQLPLTCSVDAESKL